MVKEALKTHILYFNSFEARETAFNQSVSQLIPCKYNGPRRFWQEFNQIVQFRLPQISSQTTAYITSNPRDCLAFGTPRQVLAAARMSALSQQPQAQHVPTVTFLAEEFALTHMLDQPLRTLSGGETVKLALAKTYCLLTCSQRLSIASPFCWLSNQNTTMLEKVVTAYQYRQLPVTLFALEGEDDLDPKSICKIKTWLGHGPHFTLTTRAARVALGTTVTELMGYPQYAAISDVTMELSSPCLVYGDNGQGKSLLAKALSGAIKSQGRIEINNQKRSSRLLFQDVINQTLLRTFKSLANSHHGVYADEVKRTFDLIRQHYLERMEDEASVLSGSSDQAHPSLLAIKIMLVAVRLCNQPKALILDEPDWGLPRQSAETLVAAIIHCAHDLGVAVIIISHKPWWQEIAQSRILVQRDNPASKPDDPCQFILKLLPR